MVSDMGRAGEMVQTTLKKQILLLIFAMSALGFGDTVLERKILSDSGSINCSNIMWVKMFLTQQSHEPFILAPGIRSNDGCSLYIRNKVIIVKYEYGAYLGGFVENNDLILAFKKGSDIGFYDVQKGFTLTKSVKIVEEMLRLFLERVIAVPELNDEFYILGQREEFPINPVEFFKNMISGGHGINYIKPYLVKIKGDEILQYRKLRYGGKTDESYTIEEVASDAKMIHFLGYRGQQQIGASMEGLLILYYAGYDIDKEKVVQTHNIFERNVNLGNNFSPMSIVSKNSDIFVVFPCVTYHQGAHGDDLKQITSDIYYFQYSSKAAGETVQIAKGFIPLVKLDATGKVYVFWLDYEGNLVCKTKQDDTWSKDKIILAGIDISPGMTNTKYIAAEFDSEDNLHLVYPSKGSLIYEKRKLSEN